MEELNPIVSIRLVYRCDCELLTVYKKSYIDKHYGHKYSTVAEYDVSCSEMERITESLFDFRTNIDSNVIIKPYIEGLDTSFISKGCQIEYSQCFKRQKLDIIDIRFNASSHLIGCFTRKITKMKGEV